MQMHDVRDYLTTYPGLDADAVIANTHPHSPEHARARLLRAEVDLLLMVLALPWPIRLPLVFAAALVRVLRG